MMIVVDFAIAVVLFVAGDTVVVVAATFAVVVATDDAPNVVATAFVIVLVNVLDIHTVGGNTEQT